CGRSALREGPAGRPCRFPLSAACNPQQSLSWWPSPCRTCGPAACPRRTAGGRSRGPSRVSQRPRRCPRAGPACSRRRSWCVLLACAILCSSSGASPCRWCVCGGAAVVAAPPILSLAAAGGLLGQVLKSGLLAGVGLDLGCDLDLAVALG